MEGIIDFKIFIKTPSFQTEGPATTFLIVQPGNRVIVGDADSTSFHFVKKMKASAKKPFSRDVPPDSSADHVAVGKGTIINAPVC